MCFFSQAPLKAATAFGEPQAKTISHLRVWLNKKQKYRLAKSPWRLANFFELSPARTNFEPPRKTHVQTNKQGQGPPFAKRRNQGAWSGNPTPPAQAFQSARASQSGAWSRLGRWRKRNQDFLWKWSAQSQLWPQIKSAFYAFWRTQILSQTHRQRSNANYHAQRIQPCPAQKTYRANPSSSGLPLAHPSLAHPPSLSGGKPKPWELPFAWRSVCA